jgi:hypothetical protein
LSHLQLIKCKQPHNEATKMHTFQIITPGVAPWADSPRCLALQPPCSRLSLRLRANRRWTRSRWTFSFWAVRATWPGGAVSFRPRQARHGTECCLPRASQLPARYAHTLCERHLFITRQQSATSIPISPLHHTAPIAPSPFSSSLRSSSLTEPESGRTPRSRCTSTLTPPKCAGSVQDWRLPMSSETWATQTESVGRTALHCTALPLAVLRGGA